MVATATPFLYGTFSGTLTATGSAACLSEGGFGNGPSAYVAREEGVLGGVSISATCTSGNSEFTSMSLTINSFGGATNITVVDGLRFYWNGTAPATATFTFTSSGSTFFTSTGPYGYLLINSTTAGTYPVHSNDNCVGSTTISPPGTGNCKLQVLPVTAGVASAVVATGTSGNTVTGLVNLSSPATVVCPPAGSLWNTGSSSCTGGNGGKITATLASGPSFVVISMGFSDAPASYPTGASSFTVIIAASVAW